MRVRRLLGKGEEAVFGLPESIVDAEGDAGNNREHGHQCGCPNKTMHRAATAERAVEVGGQDVDPRIGIVTGFVKSVERQRHGPVFGKSRRLIRIAREIRLDIGTAMRDELTIDVTVQVHLGDGLTVTVMRLCHLTIRNFACASVAISCRKVSRPRDRRDMIVPMGTPSVVAAS